MEINKDEALRCLSIAKNHYGSGNFAAAVRFSRKSIKLYPTDEAKAFLEKAEGSAADQPTGTSTATSNASPMNGSTKADSSPSNSSTPSSDKKHTKEQAAAVKQILACGTDYYRVLSLEKDCTEIQIKKSYRKLALQFHPDKNSAPGADEAFKLISKAFTVLSDPQKRAVHDAGGGDPEQRGMGGGGGGGMHPGFHSFRTHQFGGGGGDEISPEELFNMFFGGGGPAGFGGPFGSATFVGPGFARRSYYHPGAGHRGQQARQHAQRNTNWTLLLQILPLLVLFGYSLLSGLFMDDTPSFSFQPTNMHSQQRTTYSHQVPYFVNPSSFRTTARDQYKLSRLEQQVEVDWVRGLQHACQAERRERAARLNAASGIFGIGRNEDQYQAALKMPMKNCEEVRRFGYNPYK